MSIFTDQNSFKPITDPITGKGDSFRNVQKFTMGSGASRIEMDIKTGLFVGADTFATAPLSIDFLGNIKATAGTFSGDITGASGTFSGKIEIKDSLGNVVILFDPNG